MKKPLGYWHLNFLTLLNMSQTSTKPILTNLDHCLSLSSVYLELHMFLTCSFFPKVTLDTFCFVLFYFIFNLFLVLTINILKLPLFYLLHGLSLFPHLFRNSAFLPILPFTLPFTSLLAIPFTSSLTIPGPEDVFERILHSLS